MILDHGEETLKTLIKVPPRGPSWLSPPRFGETRGTREVCAGFAVHSSFLADDGSRTRKPRTWKDRALPIELHPLILKIKSVEKRPFSGRFSTDFSYLKLTAACQTKANKMNNTGIMGNTSTIGAKGA